MNGFIHRHCGAVHVFYGSPDGGFYTTTDSLFHEEINGVSIGCEADDRFGDAVASGDFDGDGYDDLAVGIPYEDVPSGQIELQDAGSVQILYGSPGGLGYARSRTFSQTGSDLEAMDTFGGSLAVGYFDDDPYADLAVGAKNEAEHGQVNVYYGSASGLNRSGEQIWGPENSQIVSFGQSLSTGDFNRDGREDLAIGAPNTEVSELFWAGAISILYGSETGLTSANRQFLHQDYDDSHGEIYGIATDIELFGWALASGDFDNDGAADLAVGVVGDLVGAIKAGAVNIIYGSDLGLTTLNNQIWDLSDPNLPDAPEQSDNLGCALTSGDFNADGYDDLAIGASQKDFGAINDSGTVVVIYGSGNGLTAVGSQAWGQDLPPEINGGAEELDQFGYSLGVLEKPMFSLALPIVIR